MTSVVPELEVTIHLGERSHRFPILALAAALRLPRTALRSALGALCLASLGEVPVSATSADGEPTEGSERNESERNETKTFGSERIGTSPEKYNSDRNETSETFGASESFGAGGDTAEGQRDEGATETVHMLAELLDDRDHLASLEVLVRTAPPAILRAALNETLTLPPERIRRTRGAYFTAAVRRRLRGPTAAEEPAP